MYVISRGRVLQEQVRAALAFVLQFPKGFAPSLGKPPFLLPAMVTMAGRVFFRNKNICCIFLVKVHGGFSRWENYCQLAFLDFYRATCKKCVSTKSDEWQ